ncbi:hypothetical protein Dimus_016660 [Dionaea muscipula]
MLEIRTQIHHIALPLIPISHFSQSSQNQLYSIIIHDARRVRTDHTQTHTSILKSHPYQKNYEQCALTPSIHTLSTKQEQSRQKYQANANPSQSQKCHNRRRLSEHHYSVDRKKQSSFIN